MAKSKFYFGKVLKAIDTKQKEALSEIGSMLDGEIKDVVPVDTGKLKDSVEHELSRNKLYVGARAEYAKEIELGTSKAEAQPFLNNTVMENLDELKAIMEKKMSEDVGD